MSIFAYCQPYNKKKKAQDISCWAKHNNLPNLQQQLMDHQNNLSNIHRQQQQLRKSKVQVQQQAQQNVTNLLRSQGKQSQPQAPQQQLIPHLQLQLGLQQQQPNPLQQDVLDQQKQLYRHHHQSQRTHPDSSSTLDSTAQSGKSRGDDWQEKVYQKIKSMKETYLPELNEMHQKIEAKLEKLERLPHQLSSDHRQKLKVFKSMLEGLIIFLQVSKANIVPSFKAKMVPYEKPIINIVSTNRSRKAMSSSIQQPRQLPPPYVDPVSQTQSQIPLVQSTNLQSSVAKMEQNHRASLQHNSISSIFGVSTTQRNMVGSMQPGANLYSNYVNSLQQNSVGAPQQNNVCDQPKQLYQLQRTLPDSSSTSLDSTAQTGKSGGDDWQEEVYQKIKSMKESYLRELTEMHQKIATKMQKHEPLPAYQCEKLKLFRTILERLMAFLQVSRANIVPIFKAKMVSHEKQIINIINSYRPRKAMSSVHLNQLPPPYIHPASQPQSQIP